MNTSNFVSIPPSMFPDQEILVLDDERLTYGQLWKEVQRLASFKKPEVIEFADALPKNHMGKVLRKNLRAQLAGAQL